KPGTFTGGRREFDVAAVGPRQRARDGQAEAGAAPAGPVPRAVRPVEAVEDAGRTLLAHAGALVGDVEDRAAVRRAAADADRRAVRGVRGGVAHEVGDHLPQPRLVAQHRRRAGRAAVRPGDLDRAGPVESPQVVAGVAGEGT